MRRYSSLTVIFLLVCWNTFAEAQLTKLRVGYSAISEVDMPAWVAKETKLFEKNGLDILRANSRYAKRPERKPPSRLNKP